MSLVVFEDELIWANKSYPLIALEFTKEDMVGGSFRLNYGSVPNQCPTISSDHQTSIVRGLLCGECNRGLGLFMDNIDILIKAIEYLKK